MNNLSKAQDRLKAPKTQSGYNNRYQYRTLDDILITVKPILSELNMMLTISDEMIDIGGRVYVKSTAILLDKDDRIIATVTGNARESESKTGMDASQLTGSASTYARKLALCGLFLIDDSAQDPDHPEYPKDSDKKTAAPDHTDKKKDAIARINKGMTFLNEKKIKVPTDILKELKNLDKLDLKTLTGMVFTMTKLASTKK